MISVSRVAQSMNRKKAVQKLKAQNGAYFPRDLRLNERRVRAGACLDDEDGQPEHREGKSLVRPRIVRKRRVSGDSRLEPPPRGERQGERTRQERHDCVAKRVHRDGDDEGREASRSPQNPTEHAYVITSDLGR